MANDVFWAKPSFLGFGVDLRELWRRISPSDPTGPAAVAARFVQLFVEHGVSRNQVPQLIPGVGLHHLASATALLPALTPETLDAACELFGVRMEWLQCVEDDIYEIRWSYKCPEEFFAEFSELQSPARIAPVRAFATDNHLDRLSGESQRIELVLVEDVAVLGDFRLERYTPLSDGRDWAYTDHRLELKSIIRAYGSPVPLYRCSAQDIDALYHRRIIPRKLMNRSFLTNPSLEDWCMSKAEHAHAKEVEELEEVSKRADLLKSLSARAVLP